MRRIAIRADASVAIGHGHVRRCLSLAQALGKFGVTSRFLARALGTDVARVAQAYGLPSIVLPAPQGVGSPPDPVPHASWAGVGWQVDAIDTVAALRDTPVDAVLVDHYAFDARWHRAVATELGCRVFAIDDLADRDMAVDTLVDHNQSEDHLAKYRGRLPAGAALLGGPRYALLGPAYATARRYHFHDTVRSIGIFMGGVDVGNYCLLAVQACRDAGFDGPLEVVAAGDHEHLQQLRSLAVDDARVTVSVDLPDLSAFFARHDLQIGASGGATWERCCIGAPSIAIVVAENQRMVVDPLRRSGVLHGIESVPPSRREIADSVRALIRDGKTRRALSQRAMALVDGLGAQRVAKHLIES